MIGTNRIILNEDTVTKMFTDHIRATLFGKMGFVVESVKHKAYDHEWEITLKGTGKEADDATES